MSWWAFTRETIRYYFIKAGLYFMYLGLRLRSALGFEVGVEELQDFELDIV